MVTDCDPGDKVQRALPQNQGGMLSEMAARVPTNDRAYPRPLPRHAEVVHVDDTCILASARARKRPTFRCRWQGWDSVR
jgi:hypothetical protein